MFFNTVYFLWISFFYNWEIQCTFHSFHELWKALRDTKMYKIFSFPSHVRDTYLRKQMNFNRAWECFIKKMKECHESFGRISYNCMILRTGQDLYFCYLSRHKEFMPVGSCWTINYNEELCWNLMWLVRWGLSPAPAESTSAIKRRVSWRKEVGKGNKKLMFWEQNHKVNTCLNGHLSYLIDGQEDTNLYFCLFERGQILFFSCSSNISFKFRFISLSLNQLVMIAL